MFLYPAFTLLAHRDSASPRRNAGVHWEGKLSVLLSFFIWKTIREAWGLLAHENNHAAADRW